MAPGPVTAATIAAGTQRRHAGALIAVGHGMVEFPLMLLIIAGAGKFFACEKVKIAVGFCGGLFLLWMAVQMLRDWGKPLDPAQRISPRSPLWTGVILSAGNPYFLLWWATVGLALANQARAFGVFAFAVFAVVHWLCDLVWLEALSWATCAGGEILGGRRQKFVLLFCAAAVLIFGVMFVFRASASLAGLLRT